MTEITYAAAPAPVRDELAAAHRRAWRRIAEPGTWLDGERRVAIAAETRNASGCALCRDRKSALSPYTVDGAHDHLGALPDDFVEVIHRVVTDPGRLTESWYQGVLDGGMTDTDYVETIGVVTNVVAIDTFARGLGIDPAPLPEPVAGAPMGQRPAGARHGGAWVPWVAPEDMTEAETAMGLYGGARQNVAHIRRALSLVPAEAIGFFDIVERQYLAGREMRAFDREFRDISHAQIELLAARVSTLNGCFY